jgi:hypothetical protein
MAIHALVAETSGDRPLSINEPKNNDKEMKWPVEAIGIFVLQDMLLEEEWKHILCASVQ